MEDILVKVAGLCKEYARQGGSVLALAHVDLEVCRGEFLVVVGKSGAGKSTLVNMLAGIDSPTRGGLTVDGVNIHALNEDGRAAWRGRTMGVVFQSFQLLPTLTILQNVMLPMDFAHSYPPSEQRERAMGLLGQMGIAEHAHKLPAAISGGQQQRVAIARALANDPPILLADEPTGSLDSGTARAVLDVLERVVAEGRTVLMVTHDKDIALRARRVITLEDGRIAGQAVSAGELH